jgi:hypothetical protein
MNNQMYQSTDMQLVDELGKQLSLAIKCPVHFPAYGKRIFECKHGVCFPLFVVEQRDWVYVQSKHDTERRMTHSPFND